MKVLLLGGTGVLSTQVCEEAIKQGYDVYTVTRGNRKKHLVDKAHNLFANVYDEKDLSSVIVNLEFDVVVDFLVRNTDDLLRTLRVVKGKCKQFIFVSTATVYSNDSNEIITEKSDIGNREWDYSLYKEECEILLKQVWKNYVQSYTIIRPYVTYGKTRIPSAIVPVAQWSLINRIINEKPIPMWDGGYAKLNLTHTTDFARGFVGLFQNEKAYLQDFHITSEEQISWKSITEYMADELQKSVITVDIPTDFMARYLPEFSGALKYDKSKNWIFDNAKICDAVPDLKFKKKAKEGLSETIRFYLENQSMQMVDYIWEGKIDCLIIKYYKSMKKSVPFGKLSLKACKEKISFKNRCLYWIGRKKFLLKIYYFLKRLLRLVNRICRRKVCNG